MEKKNWSLIGGNTLAFIGVIVVNTLAVTLPINQKGTGELSDALPNLFVPSGLTFSVWSLIYLSLFGFIFYQYISKSVEHKSMGPWFIISSVMNMSWIFAWHYEQIILSIFLMLGILGSLIVIYLKLGIGKKDNLSIGEKIFVHFPFSIYLGWITIATVANFTTLFVSMGWKGGSLGESVWTVLMIIAAFLICAVILYRHKDLAYTAVVVWALLGIIIKRSGAVPVYENIIITASVTGGLLLIGAIVVGIHKLLRKKEPLM